MRPRIYRTKLLWSGLLTHVAAAVCAGADDISDAEEKYVRVEVWDYKLVKKFRGRVDVPLKRVLDKQNFNERVTDKFRCLLLAAQTLASWLQSQTPRI